MAFDGICMHALCIEMNKNLQGCYISKISQPEKEELIITFKGNGQTKRLLISANASLPLIYFTDENKTAPINAPNFCMLLRKHIGSGKIISVEQVDFERVIRITIEHFDELGELCRKYLYIEIMGKHSNIIFTTTDNVIIDSIKHVSFSVSSVREVLPQRDYFIPAQEGKENPLLATHDIFYNVILSKPTTGAKAIYTSYMGLSPLIANEICYRANLDGDAPCSSYTIEQKENLTNVFLCTIEEIKKGEFTPIIYKNDKNFPKEFYVLKLNSYQNYTKNECESISSMLETYYSQKNKQTNIAQKSSDIRKHISTLLERNEKKRIIQEKQLKDTQKMEQYRLFGELLQTYGHSIVSGQKNIEVLNYYNNENINIPLDETLNGIDNSKRYFEKYQKAKRTKEAVEVQLLETNQTSELLKSIEAALLICENEKDLEAVHQELINYGFMKRHSTKTKQKALKQKPLHFVTDDNYHIYVGKNNTQNDELTFHFATGNDWWFHTKSVHGSHVIVKNPSQGDLPDHIYDIAAGLAAYYSAARDASKVEVDYIQKKHVKKPNASVAGFVVYYTNFSMVATPSKEKVSLKND